MKTIKLIDLLNMLANCEKMPKRIKFHNMIFKLVKIGSVVDYKGGQCETLFNSKWHLTGSLNDEVEIIEEEKKIVKGIKPFKEYLKDIGEDLEDFEEFFVEYFDMLNKQVNEIIESIDDLKKEGKSE